MLRKFAVLTLLFIAAAGWAIAAGGGTTVKIMTQNMDDGTDQGYIVAASQGAMSLADAVDLTFSELQASHLEQRDALLAGKIAAQKPDIIALEEVALWRIGPTPNTAIVPVYDHLAFLLLELLKHGAFYDVVAVNTVDDVALPGNKIGALRYTDRNVLLARVDLSPPLLRFSNVQSHIFNAFLPFAGLQIHSGWISADVGVGAKQFHLVTTHLESTVPGVPEATAVQVAQAEELLTSLHNTTGPVVICGDFNSDANDNPASVDFTPSADDIRAAGFTDVWSMTHPGDPGNTWPLYLEDQFPVAFPPFTPFERIDLIFSRGMQILSEAQVVAPGAPGFSPPFASDHAGVIATLGM
ncbi:MAG TPA: endonuclease/exonuclease/phosphatase family protein [Bryobacteraceae bacterium]|nr:endonuclease/exonuclease/phosphatase family protein [Bryobacteraceae bacterium]